jgi:excisionase family DNA binding protein
MQDLKDFFSTVEAARILKISRIAIFQKIKKGEIKAVKVGRNYVIPRDEVSKALGTILGEASKENIDRIVKRAVKEYGKTFRKLGKEE